MESCELEEHYVVALLMPVPSAFAFPPSANLVLDNQYQGALPPNPVRDFNG